MTLDKGTSVPWDDAVRVVERIQGEKWIEFRDRHGDVGRDLVLYLGRRVCGMSIRELAQESGLEYVSAAAAVRRFSERVQNNGKIAKFVQRAAHQLYNA